MSPLGRAVVVPVALLGYAAAMEPMDARIAALHAKIAKFEAPTERVSAQVCGFRYRKHAALGGQSVIQLDRFSLFALRLPHLVRMLGKQQVRCCHV